MSNHSFVPQTLDPRCAGNLARYHTWPCINQQTVAAHTWNLLRLLLAVWPECPREVLVDTMFHDVGERVTGDVPYPVKAENPEVKRAFDAMEDRARLLMATRWGIVARQPLPLEDRHAVKLCEFIEMMEYALDEQALGNRNMALISERCYEQAIKMIKSEETTLPSGVREAANNYLQRRLSHERRYRSR